MITQDNDDKFPNNAEINRNCETLEERLDYMYQYSKEMIEEDKKVFCIFTQMIKENKLR